MITLELIENSGLQEVDFLLQVEGEMSIEHGAEIKQALLELFATKGSIGIDCSNVERIDLTGMLLLCSAMRTASQQQKPLTVRGNESPVFLRSFQGAGLPESYVEILAELGRE